MANITNRFDRSFIRTFFLIERSLGRCFVHEQRQLFKRMRTLSSATYIGLWSPFTIHDRFTVKGCILRPRSVPKWIYTSMYTRDSCRVMGDLRCSQILSRVLSQLVKAVYAITRKSDGPMGLSVTGLCSARVDRVGRCREERSRSILSDRETLTEIIIWLLGKAVAI